MTTKDEFTITCSPEGHTVTMTESVRDGGQFATELSHAHDVLRYFRMTKQCSVWAAMAWTTTSRSASAWCV
jgi:hypothetical protein